MAHILSNHSLITALIESERKRWAGYVACMGESKNAHMVPAENPVEKKSHLEEVCVDGKTRSSNNKIHNKL